MIENNKNNLVKILTIIFFIDALLEIISEQFHFEILIYVTKPLIPIILMLLYWVSSEQRNILFFLTLFFSVITNLLFIPNNENYLFYGIIIFTIHRILMLYYIYKIVRINNFLPFILCTIPLLLIFFYLFVESTYVPQNSFVILALQIFLIGCFGGIALSKYIFDDTKQNSYLMICALLFVALQFVIFIEKYFLHSLPLRSLRPIAMSLNVLAFYAFYMFIMVSEEKKSLHNN